MRAYVQLQKPPKLKFFDNPTNMVAPADSTLEKCIRTLKEHLCDRDFKIVNVEDNTIGLLGTDTSSIHQAIDHFKQNDVDRVVAPYLPDEIAPHVSDGQLDYFCQHFFFLPTVIEDAWLEKSSVTSRKYQATFFYDSSEGINAHAITQRQDENGRPLPIPVALSEMQPALAKLDAHYRLIDLNTTPLDASLFQNTAACVIYLNDLNRLFEICLLAAYHGSGTCHWPQQTTGPFGLRFLLAGIRLQTVNFESGSIRDIFKAIDNCTRKTADAYHIDSNWVKHTVHQFRLENACRNIKAQLANRFGQPGKSEKLHYPSFINDIYGDPPAPEFWHIREELVAMPEPQHQQPWGKVNHPYLLQVFARCLLYEQQNDSATYQKIACAVKEWVQIDLAWFVVCLSGFPRLSFIFQTFWNQFDWWETAVEDALEEIYASNASAHDQYINLAHAYTRGSRRLHISQPHILEKCHRYIAKDIQQKRFNPNSLIRQATLWYQQWGVSSELETHTRAFYREHPDQRAILATAANLLDPASDLSDIISLYQLDISIQSLPHSFNHTFLRYLAQRDGLSATKRMLADIESKDPSYQHGSLDIAWCIAQMHGKKVFNPDNNSKFAELALEGSARCREATSPASQDAQYLNTYFQLILGDYDQAYSIIDRIDEGNPLLENALILAFWALGAESHAKALLEKQVQLSTRPLLARLYSGLMHILLQDYDQALKDYSRLYDEYSKYFSKPTHFHEKWSVHALALKALNLDEAFNTFQDHARQLDPHYCEYQCLFDKLPSVNHSKLQSVAAQFQPFV